MPLVRPFFEAADRGEFQIVTSILTLTEVLVHPLRRGDPRLADQCRRILLRAGQMTTVAVSEEIAEKAAELRGQHGLRTRDALQACNRNTVRSRFVQNE
jgi:predicted nucleic acid-binding protein